ncbi:CDP-alcohol phosphatidyltransferase family protein [Actinomadura terrae]|uniref:CDP-alcohol phosphatidyltransferase family protein n=1 Tax=Actinomadura terrae TaxID=604353 RepID=UPI001FA769C9|nr:CDP-alcohol phosphatidyltransferase family protein [Actinomadura terrae]
MDGLYALKPWYAARLGGVRAALVRRGVSPDAVTAAGVLSGGAAGAALALVEPGPAAGLLVTVLLAARLACANLDGAIARESGRSTRWGAVLNELGDRAAELAALAGCLALAPAWLVASAALAATLPSWTSLAGAAAGGPRPQGGPVGKTERCLLLALVAFTGWAVPLLATLAAGSVLTAAVRLRRIRRSL